MTTGISFLLSRVKVYISNCWDKRIVDPDPNKLYTQKQAQKDMEHEELDGVSEEDHDHVIVKIGQRVRTPSRYKGSYHHC